MSTVHDILACHVPGTRSSGLVGMRPSPRTKVTASLDAKSFQF